MANTALLIGVLFGLLGLAFLFYLVHVFAKTAQGVTMTIDSAIKAPTENMESMFDVVYRVGEVTRASPQMWPAMTIDHLGLPLDLQDELESLTYHCVGIAEDEGLDARRLYIAGVLEIVNYERGGV